MRMEKLKIITGNFIQSTRYTCVLMVLVTVMIDIFAQINRTYYSREKKKYIGFVLS